MKRLTTALLLSLALTATTTQAAIIFTAATATTTGSLTITQDINFTITTSGSWGLVVLDEWVTNDGTLNLIAGTNQANGSTIVTPGTMAYALNGVPGSANIGAGGFIMDNYGTLNFPFPGTNLTANDGYLAIDPASSAAFVVGDIVTLTAQTWTFAAGSTPATFNLQQNGQSYTGDVFLSGSFGNRISGITSAAGSVPEPAAALTGLLSLGLLAARRRR